MVTFVPAFVSNAVVEWERHLNEAMAEAGADHRDLDQRSSFAKSWSGPPKPKATIEEVVAHVEHAREVAGLNHIGIGGDYDGVDALPDGLEDVSRYPVLFAALLERGWSEKECAKLAGENVLRAMEAAEEVAGQAEVR
jgi:membrane dipeptidase